MFLLFIISRGILYTETGTQGGSFRIIDTKCFKLFIKFITSYFHFFLGKVFSFFKYFKHLLTD